MNSAMKKAEFLGMPWGTASNRLRKRIMFHLLQKAQENVCFVCCEEITCAEDLSVEHKKPWFNEDVELFWDMDNIAFSHVTCNRPHNRPGPHIYKNT